METEERQYSEEEIHLLDYLIVCLKQRRMIVAITLSVGLLTALISLVMAPQYRAETRIFSAPRESTGMAVQLMAQFNGLAGFAGSAAGMQEPNKLFVEMLESRTILDAVIDRFDLIKVYDQEFKFKARKILQKHLRIKDDVKSGVITVAVDDRDRKAAADMANAMVEELKSLVKELAVTEASQRRLFFEQQLKETKLSLVQSEEAMRAFQEDTGALQVESQAETTIEGIAELQAKISDKEVQMNVMRTYSTPYNPDVQKLKETLRGLKAELKKLETGNGDGHDPIMPTGRMPQVGTEYLRRLRDLKFNEALYELLMKQYQSAKLDESREAMLIQVIDRAEPPEKKVKPRRTLMVLIATLAAFMLSLVAAVIREALDRLTSDPAHRDRIETIKRNSFFGTKDMEARLP